MKTSQFGLNQCMQRFADEEDYLESMGEDRPMKCLCPRCGTQHVMILFWTGRGQPRKFCPICKSACEKVAGEPSLAVSAGHRVLRHFRRLPDEHN